MSSSQLLSLNPFEPERHIGSVSEVSKKELEIELDSQSQQAVSFSNVGSFVTIKSKTIAVFGQLIELKNKWTSDGSGSSKRVVGIVELLATINTVEGLIHQGIDHYPVVGEEVFAASSEIIQLVFQSDRHTASQADPLLLNLAQISKHDETQIKFTPERVFGAHCGVMGTTGGGKSWTVARIVEECARFRCKIIMFDPTGEFYTLSRRVQHVHIGADPEPREDSEEGTVPYFDLTENDLYAIFKPSGQSQAPKLKAAMKSLKLARISSSVAVDGLIVKAHKSKQHFEQEYRRYIDEIEKPYASFDIRLLNRQIENECINPQRSPSEPTVWGGPNTNDYSYCVPLINRIEDIIESPSLAAIFKPQRGTSLFKLIHNFLKDPSKQILRISLKHLPFAYQAREIVANAVGRHLMELARAYCFREMPLMVVLDEAHQFLDKSVDSEAMHYPLEAFSLIAKEGRKYAINILLATQRPRDIPEDVLSQMGTLIVHRLINDHDRSVVERASGEMARSVAEAIPNLSPGEAVVVGVDFAVPMLLKIIEPKYKPDSKGPNFQRYWR